MIDQFKLRKVATVFKNFIVFGWYVAGMLNRFGRRVLFSRVATKCNENQLGKKTFLETNARCYHVLLFKIEIAPCA